MKTFPLHVLGACRRIPHGKVATYSEIARFLGNPGASRAVGNALRRNERPVEIPCHRVVKSDGSIGGYSGSVTDGAGRKRQLLEGEGILVKNGRIDLKVYGFWFGLKKAD